MCVIWGVERLFRKLDVLGVRFAGKGELRIGWRGLRLLIENTDVLLSFAEWVS